MSYLDSKIWLSMKDTYRITWISEMKYIMNMKKFTQFQPQRDQLGFDFDASNLSTFDFSCIITRFLKVNLPLARPNSKIAPLKSPGTFGWSSSGLRARVIAAVGQVDTHSPQPMHLSLSTDAFSSTRWTASIWQRSSQTPQPMHVSSSITAKNGLQVKLAGLG